MTTRWSQRRVPLGLAGLSFLIALAQHPGVVVADTKVNLYVDPARFLSDVVSGWTATGSLGHVFSGQYGGYLWPMAPFFALGHAVALPTWITQRLWLGLLPALGAWGLVRLLDALWSPRRGVAHLVAGALLVVNPYVAVYDDRTSVTLLGYAALPWLLLAVHRGLREPRRWTWPALFALLVTSAGGGVNATVVAFMLVGPLVLLVYELAYGDVPHSAVRPWLSRLVPLTILASVWWVVGVGVNSVYGLNFLPFTEQPGTVWNTTSLTEALRLMGFWTSYFGFGFDGVRRPFTADSGALLFALPVVVASLVVPALALLGFTWTRTRRYAPFFLLLVLAGLLIVTAGFPNGTPLRRGLDFTYSHVVAVQFLRTSYKAAPLISLGIACLAGLGAAELWGRLGALRAAPGAIAARLARLGPRVVLALLGAALIGLAAWPLLRGRALDGQLALPHGVPAAWTDTAAELDHDLPVNDRAMILPGQLFAYYTWGGTVDAILPVLTSRPVAVRTTTPYADMRAVDLQWSVDDLITQQRGYPGQLAPLLDLLGVGQVISATDDDRTRSGGPPPGDAAIALRGQGLGAPAHAYGAVAPAAVRAGSLARAPLEPQVRVYDTRTAGIIRVLPRSDETVLDGDGDGIVDLSALGALTPSDPLRYAADLSDAQVRQAAAAGAHFVISDSNRRQIFVASRLQANRGPTLGPTDPISVDSALLDPFPAEGTAAQTVADLAGGVASVTAPYSPGFSQFPEHRPFAAIDGDPGTEWLADRALAPSRWYLTVTFTHPRAVPYVDLTPYDDSHGIVTEVAVNGRSFAVHPGANRLAVNLRAVGALQVLLAHVAIPGGEKGSAGGISELSIPGIRASETLRPPVELEDALRGVNLRRDSLAYVFSRTTGDDPTQRSPFVGAAGAALTRDAGDGETVLARSVVMPAARSFSARAWVQVAANAADPLLDRLAGYDGPLSFSSSGRFEGDPAYRASSAFSGVGTPGWIGDWLTGHPAWLAWSGPSLLRVGHLTLVPPAVDVRHVTSVRLEYDGGATGPLPVSADGTVSLPRAIRSRHFRLDILAAAFPAGTSGLMRQRRAVGIARVLGVQGLGPVAIAQSGALRGGCADVAVTIDGARVGLTVRGTVSELDAAQPLSAVACGAPVTVTAGAHTVRSLAGPLLVNLLMLDSPAPDPPAAAASAGSVIDPGTPGDGSYTHVRVAVTQPAWLVLGEGYNRGWTATCDGHALGAPVPLQGFANAWPVTPGCTNVTLRFGPNRVMVVADVLSGVAALAMLLGLVWAAVRRSRRRPAEGVDDGDPGAPLPSGTLWPDLRPTAPRGLPVGRAIALGMVFGLIVAFMFALRAGAVAAPVIAVLLWRGVGARALCLTAGALMLVVVPALYVVVGAHDHGGYDSNYAIDLISAHWVALVAMLALVMALVRTLVGARTVN